MAANNKDATLLRLLDALRELDEKRDAVLAEMRVCLDGGDGLGIRIGRCKVCFVGGWNHLYQSKLVVNGTAQVVMSANLKAFIIAVGEAETVTRMAFYFASKDAYYLQRRHPFELFVRDFNALIGLPFDAPRDDGSALDRARELRGQ